VGLVLFWFVGVYRPQQNVAVLTRAVDAEWAGSTNGPTTGARLKPGWLHLTRARFKSISAAEPGFSAKRQRFFTSSLIEKPSVVWPVSRPSSGQGARI